MIFRSRFFAHIDRTSCLGFGTPALVGIQSEAERQRLFLQLLDSGINHFDTAPYYGYGAAESILGTLVRGRRHEVTITTKFGIQPPRLLKSRLVNRLARRVLKGVPKLRGILSRGAQATTTRGAFSPEDARRSLESSLRALQTTYVDLLLLHEPLGADALSEDLVAFLNDQVSAGTIRAFGCGGGFDGVRALAEGPAVCEYLQFEDSLTEPNRDAIAPERKAITYRCIAALPDVLRRRLLSDPALLAHWNAELDRDCSEPATLGALLVGAALERNPDGLVLFSSTKAANVVAAIAGASANEPALVRRFWALARTQLARSELTPLVANQR